MKLVTVAALLSFTALAFAAPTPNKDVTLQLEQLPEIVRTSSLFTRSRGILPLSLVLAVRCLPAGAEGRRHR